MNALDGWANFYVITGASAGTLIGLQFVALTLYANGPQRDTQPLENAGRAFSTPTVIHFGAVLLSAGILSAPWGTVTSAATAIGLLGGCGLVYGFVVLRRMATQTAYRPQLEDWVFHGIVPTIAYATIVTSAILARSHARNALFAIAGAVLALLVSGIHNAWDAVTYHIFTVRPQLRAEQAAAKTEPLLTQEAPQGEPLT